MSSRGEVLHLTPVDAVERPWKNGRGVTRELALWPPGASFERNDFEWRISTSSVSAAGPFSAFPGFERLLLVTRGEGLVLAHAGEAPRTRLRALEPYRFAGDGSTTCELVRGPVEDFNVIYSAARWLAYVEAWRLGRRRRFETIGPGHAFVHVLEGSGLARVSNEEEPFQLAAGESLWMQRVEQEAEIEISGAADDTLVLLARLEPAGATGR